MLISTPTSNIYPTLTNLSILKYQDVLVTRLYICAVSPLFLQNLHSRPGIVGGGDGGCPDGEAVNIGGGGGERAPPPRAWPGPGKER